MPPLIELGALALSATALASHCSAKPTGCAGEPTFRSL